MTRPPLCTPGAPHARVTERVVAALSLAPEGSLAHLVAPHGEGLRVQVPDAPVYAYALPWARGWSVFVTADPYATNHSWRSNLGYARKVTNMRGVIGPENADPTLVIDAFIDAIDYLEINYRTDFGDEPLYTIDLDSHVPVTAPTNCVLGPLGDDEDDYFDGEDGGPGDCVFYGL